MKIHSADDNFLCVINIFCNRPPTGLSSYRDERKENGTGDENEKSHNYDSDNDECHDLFHRVVE